MSHRKYKTILTNLKPEEKIELLEQIAVDMNLAVVFFSKENVEDYLEIKIAYDDWYKSLDDLEGDIGDIRIFNTILKNYYME